MFLTAFHGLCMALADSVPGVSGGTIAFILGFYERFLDALHALFQKDRAAAALILRGSEPRRTQYARCGGTYPPG